MLINELWKIPFLRFLLPFIAGILLSPILNINVLFFIVLTLFFTALAFVYKPFSDHNPSYQNRWIFGLLISLSLFCISIALTKNNNRQSIDIKNAEIIDGIVNKPVQETQNAVKLQFKVSRFQKKGIWVNNNSNILFYFEKDSSAKNLKFGDRLVIKCTPIEIKNKGNPEEFDYKKYLNRKQIYYQSYVKSQHWHKLSENNGNIIYSYAYKIRNEILQIYKSSGIKGDELAILAALTLGVKDYLNEDIVEAFSDSGAMHVLAVSGLHVGIIAVMLNFLLALLRKNKKLKIIHSLLVICFIWFFALLTGLAPSVTRSSIMFSFFILGQNSGKKPSSYNSLAASAFIILCFNPNTLFYVGFQLSFLAVISILFFQPKIYRFLDIKNRWINYIWQITTVSIAAQIGTTPISIFYFHQFPVYALLTNLIVIPLAGISMYGTVLLLISSIYAPLAKYIAVLLSMILQFLNKSTSLIESTPYSCIENISISQTELILIYLALLLVLINYTIKKRKVVYIIIILACISFSIRNIRFLQRTNDSKFIVFNTTNKTTFATISNKEMHLFSDSLLINNKKAKDYLVSNIKTRQFIKHLRISIINKREHNLPFKFITINNLRIVYLIDKTDQFKTIKKLSVNYLITGNQSTLSLDNILSLFSFDKLIIDSSTPKWKQDVLKEECIRKKIPFYNVSESGAFVWNFNK